MTPGLPRTAALRRRERLLANRWVRRLPLLLVFPVGCALAALAIGQDANYDLLNYHYYIAYAFLHDRLQTDVYPAQLQSLLNPFLDVPVYLLMNHTPPRVEAAIVGAVQGLNPLIVYLIGRRLSRSWLVAAAAALAAAIAGGFVSEIGNSMGDTLVSIPLLLGVLFAVRAIQATEPQPESALASGVGGARSPGRRRVAPELWWWAAAGLAAGIGAGLKFSELPVGIGIALAVVVVRGRAGVRVKRTVFCVVGGIVGVLLPSGYWSWYLWRHYQDPIAFTQATFGIFHSPYVPTASIGGANFGPMSLSQALYYPVYWFFHPLSVAETPIRALAMPLAYVVAAVLVVAVCLRSLGRLARRQRPWSAPVLDASERVDSDTDRYLITAFAIALAIWMKVFATYRYIVPLELVSPLVLYAAWRRVVSLGATRSRLRALAQRALAPAFLVACVACMATAYPGNYWLRVPFGSSKYFSLATPPILRNGRVDAVVEVGGLPMGFLFPQLPSRIIAFGGIGNLLTPANTRLAFRTMAKVRKDGGTVNVVFVDEPALPALETPGGTSSYLALLGAPGLVSQACDAERAYIGVGYQPVKFCRFGRPTKAR